MQPLVEEYTTAQHFWKLSQHDLCEIARNSVLISGFEHGLKCAWLGQNYRYFGPRGNVPDLTNVPDIRLQYRQDTLLAEIDYLIRHVNASELVDKDASYLQLLRRRYSNQ